MKVIDVLNRIANGEELPNKIRFNNIEWNRVYGEKNVCYIDEYDNDFFLHFFRNNLDFTLNDEIEIIEEDKKIEKLEIVHNGSANAYALLNEYGTKCALTKHSKVMCDKINEIIDKLNEMEKE